MVTVRNGGRGREWWVGLVILLGGTLLAPLDAGAQQRHYPFAYDEPRDLYNPDSPRGRVYVAGSGGLTFASDVDLEEVGGDEFDFEDLEMSIDDGFYASAAVGRYFDPLRAEIELAYRENEVSSENLVGITVLEGDLSYITLMGNVYFDLHLHDRWDVYVGGGLGFARAELDGTARPFIIDLDVDEDEYVFALQGMVGTAIHLSDNLAITGGYRLLHTADLDFGDTDFDTPLVHTVEVGLRWTF